MVLAPVIPLVVAFICLALATIATVLLIHVMDALGGVPGIGGYLQRAARSVAQAISNACGTVLGGIESLIGGTFHKCAEFLDKTWHLIRDTPAVLARVAWDVGNGLYRVTGLKALVHRLQRLVHTVLRTEAHLVRRLHGIERGLRTLERELDKGIGEDVLPRLHDLERDLTRLRHRVIPRIRDLAGEAEADAQAALGKIEAIPWNVNWKTWAEAIAAGLTALGLGWLRCDSNPFNRNPRACSALGDLGDLLGLIVAAELALDFEALVHEAQAVAEVTAEGIMAAFGLSDG